MAQVHKKFSDSQVKEMITRYLAKEIKREHYIYVKINKQIKHTYPMLPH